jgi:hypothetical protein
MNKIPLFFMMIFSLAGFDLFCNDCNLKRFIKEDQLKEILKKHDLSLEDISIFGKEPFYGAANIYFSLLKYDDCCREQVRVNWKQELLKREQERHARDREEHLNKYEEIKKYRAKVAKSTPYNHDQQGSIRFNLRYEEAYLFRLDHADIADTMEFKELTSATRDIDHSSENVQHCECEWLRDGYKKTLIQAEQRHRAAIKDFESLDSVKKANVKNPFSKLT